MISKHISLNLKPFIVTVVINGARVHDARETSAGFCGGLVDTFAQRLQPGK